MPSAERSPHRLEALRRLEREFENTRRQLQGIGFVLQGSVRERWMLCGKPACRCKEDPNARHGPYHQWSRKSKGRTVSAYLSDAQAAIAKGWVRNNRELDKVVKRLRHLSLRTARLFEIPPK